MRVRRQESSAARNIIDAISDLTTYLVIVR
jgi:hypothetical protein